MSEQPCGYREHAMLSTVHPATFTDGAVALLWYRSDATRLAHDACQRCVSRWLWAADTLGDGALVNALCMIGRERFGPTLDW